MNNKMTSNALPDDTDFIDAIADHAPIRDNEIVEFESFLDENFDSMASSNFAGSVSSTITSSALRANNWGSRRQSFEMDESERSGFMPASAAVDESERSGLSKSIGSIMTFDFDDLTRSIESITFNMNVEEEPRQQIKEQPTFQERAEPPRRRNGRSRPSRNNRSQRSFTLNHVDFDPIPYNPDDPRHGCESLNSSFNTARTSNIHQQHQDSLSFDRSMSVQSFPAVTVPTPPLANPTLNNTMGRSHSVGNFYRPDERNDNAEAMVQTPIARNTNHLACHYSQATPIANNTSLSNNHFHSSPVPSVAAAPGPRNNNFSYPAPAVAPAPLPSPPSPVTPDKYNAALAKLAESMKRTEASRQQVLQQREQMKAAEREKMEMMQARERSTAVTQFLTGSRTTLTSGLEESRRQLAMYMGNVNQRTF